MIPWVHVLCCQWGREVRKQWLEDDGYPGRSSMVMLIEGVYLTEHSVYTQHFPEVFSKRALAVSRLVNGRLNYDQKRVVFLHYVVNWEDAKEKALRLHLDRSTYYRRLNAANSRMACELEAPLYVPKVARASVAV